MTATRLAVLDLPEGNAMRAPGEAPGLMALEIAMDEMAEKLGIDPVEFRILNDTQVSRLRRATEPAKPPVRSRSGSSSSACAPGAERFGWSKRNAAARRRCATAAGWSAWAWPRRFRNNLVMKSAARVRLDSRGIVTVETDMTDIGTGSYTIIAQTAAEMMGVPLEQGRRAARRLEPSRCPAGSGGQWGGNSSTAGVYAACVKLREAVAQKLGLDCGRRGVRRRHGARRRRAACRSREAAGDEGLVAEDAIEFGDLDKKYQQSTFGAHFVEVGVDAATGEMRVRRMLAVCAAGRILNPKTARSQVIGAHDDGRRRGADGGARRRQAAAASSSTTTWPATRCRCMPTSRTRT